MSLRSTATFAMVTFFGCIASSPANACWLTDWLYGRQAASYSYGAAYPYTAGYPGTMGGVAYTAPVAGYSAAMIPVGGQLPVGTPAPTYSLQRPSYSNPSVYTGLPVAAGPSLYGANRLPIIGPRSSFTSNVPLAGSLRGVASTANPIYGTGNRYPDNYQSALPVTTVAPTPITPVTGFAPILGTSLGSYTANYPQSAITPTTSLPVTAAAPVFAPAPVRTPGPLARFFGSLLGTNYRSSYYRAPITYYRPATSIDPVSGTTVTVQQPCTSYVQQLQRTPYASLQPAFAGQPAVVTQPMDGTCVTGLGAGGIGQVGASIPAYPQSNFVQPIPSTTLPLQGTTTYGPIDSTLGGDPSDQSPVEQPELGARREPLTGSDLDNEPPVRAPEPPTDQQDDDDYYKSRSPIDDDSMPDLTPPAPSETDPAETARRDPRSSTYTTVRGGSGWQPRGSAESLPRTIPVPPDYRRPFSGIRSDIDSSSFRPPSVPPSINGDANRTLVAPPLPPARPSVMETQRAPYDSVPSMRVREASLIQGRDRQSSRPNVRPPTEARAETRAEYLKRKYQIDTDWD
ncbi:MAG: hypothetical protein AAGA03_02410 [Planctomycetota bacterium]